MFTKQQSELEAQQEAIKKQQEQAAAYDASEQQRDPYGSPMDSAEHMFRRFSPEEVERDERRFRADMDNMEAARSRFLEGRDVFRDKHTK